MMLNSYLYSKQLCIHANCLSCDIRIASLSMSESADNIRTRCPALSRPMKSFSIKYTQTFELSEQKSQSV